MTLSIPAYHLFHQLDPHKVGTPSRSPSKSPLHIQKRTEYLCLLEQAVILLLSQSTRYLVDPSIDVHDKQVLKKELANELVSWAQLLVMTSSSDVIHITLSNVIIITSFSDDIIISYLQSNFSHLLLLNFSRKGAPSPGKTPTTAPTLLGSSLVLHDGSSGKTSSLTFSETSEQGIFRLADSFAKHFFR